MVCENKNWKVVQNILKELVTHSKLSNRTVFVDYIFGNVPHTLVRLRNKYNEMEFTFQIVD